MRSARALPARAARGRSRDAIVVVTGYKGFYLPETQEAKELRIEGCAYHDAHAHAHVRRAHRGEEPLEGLLDAHARAGAEHGPDDGDAGRRSGEDLPEEARALPALDRDRKYAVVDVYAFLHPLHTASALTGYYRIDGVPVGKLKVSSTHPHIDSNAEADVTVAAGVVHKVDLVLKNVNKDAGAPPAPDAAAAPPLR